MTTVFFTVCLCLFTFLWTRTEIVVCETIRQETESDLTLNGDSINAILKEIESDYDFILDEDSARFLLEESRIESFQPLPFTYAVYKKWSKLSPLTKLVYLIDHYYLFAIRTEFHRLLQTQQPFKEDSNGLIQQRGFNQAQLRKQLTDYQDEKGIKLFFKSCDVDTDGLVDWFEYLLCRGHHDRNGHISDPSEFDVIENSVRSNFADRLNNPHDPMVLDLIKRGII